VEYAARNDVESALFRYLNDKFSTKHRISVERVVSGTGLANVYEFLAQYYPKRVDTTFHAAFEQAMPDKKPELVSLRAHQDHDKDQKDATKTGGWPIQREPSLCLLAMNIMMSAYGCEVGSAAIKWIPTGGLFVTGGLTPKNMHFIAAGSKDDITEFMQSYLHKGRVSTLLERIPLYAVKVEDLGVRGAHKAAQMALEQYQQQQQQQQQREKQQGVIMSTTTNKTGASSGGGGLACSALLQGEWPWCMTVMAMAALGFAVGAAFAKNK
jgi:glucokinase